MNLTASDRRTEDISIVSIIVPKLKFSDVQMQIFLANLMVHPTTPRFKID
jgi:hypothetical protein